MWIVFQLNPSSCWARWVPTQFWQGVLLDVVHHVLHARDQDTAIDRKCLLLPMNLRNVHRQITHAILWSELHALKPAKWRTLSQQSTGVIHVLCQNFMDSNCWSLVRVNIHHVEFKNSANTSLSKSWLTNDKLMNKTQIWENKTLAKPMVRILSQMALDAKIRTKSDNRFSTSCQGIRPHVQHNAPHEQLEFGSRVATATANNKRRQCWCPHVVW